MNDLPMAEEESMAEEADEEDIDEEAGRDELLEKEKIEYVAEGE